MASNSLLSSLDPLKRALSTLKSVDVHPLSLLPPELAQDTVANILAQSCHVLRDVDAQVNGLMPPAHITKTFSVFREAGQIQSSLENLRSLSQRAEFHSSLRSLYRLPKQPLTSSLSAIARRMHLEVFVEASEETRTKMLTMGGKVAVLDFEVSESDTDILKCSFTWSTDSKSDPELNALLLQLLALDDLGLFEQAIREIARLDALTASSEQDFFAIARDTASHFSALDTAACLERLSAYQPLALPYRILPHLTYVLHVPASTLLDPQVQSAPNLNQLLSEILNRQTLVQLAHIRPVHSR